MERKPSVFLSQTKKKEWTRMAHAQIPPQYAMVSMPYVRSAFGMLYGRSQIASKAGEIYLISFLDGYSFSFMQNLLSVCCLFIFSSSFFSLQSQHAFYCDKHAHAQIYARTQLARCKSHKFPFTEYSTPNSPSFFVFPLLF